MRQRLFSMLLSILMGLSAFAGSKVIKITAVPKEAAIYVNNTFVGNGYGEFSKPKRKQVAIIRIECNEYKPILTKFYGDDKRQSVSFTLQQDGFYRASAASGIVNKFFTVDIAPQYYSVDNNKVDVSKAWKLLHQILLNYFSEIATTDFDGGYVQTPWQYKTFNECPQISN